MDDIRQDVTEQQLDAVAGRVAELERRTTELIKALSKPEVSTRIGLTVGQVQEFTRTFLTVQSADLRHYNERQKAIRQAEKDRLFSRLRSEPGLAYPEARRALAALEGPLPVRQVHGRQPSEQSKTRQRRKHARA